MAEPDKERPEWHLPVRKVGVKYTSVDQLHAAATEYFEYCYRTQEMPTMSGMYLALGVTRSAAKCWKKKREDLYGVVESARMLVEYFLERMLVDPRYCKAVAGIIFSLKNNFGWAEENPDNKEAGQQRVTFVMNIGQATPKRSISFVKNGTTIDVPGITEQAHVQQLEEPCLPK